MGEVLVNDLCVESLLDVETGGLDWDSFDDERERRVLGESERIVRIDLEDGILDDLGIAVRRNDELGRREIVETVLRLDTDERDDEDDIEREGVRTRDDETLDVEGTRRDEDEDDEEILRDRDFEAPCEMLMETSTSVQLNPTTQHQRDTLENSHIFCMVPTGATDQLASNCQ